MGNRLNCCFVVLGICLWGESFVSIRFGFIISFTCFLFNMITTHLPIKTKTQFVHTKIQTNKKLLHGKHWIETSHVHWSQHLKWIYHAMIEESLHNHGRFLSGPLIHTGNMWVLSTVGNIKVFLLCSSPTSHVLVYILVNILCCFNFFVHQKTWNFFFL